MTRYLSTADIAAWFGITSAAVKQWVRRYSDFPQPDAVVGQTAKGRMYGWLPEREAEIRAWEKSRVGQGARTDLKGQP